MGWCREWGPMNRDCYRHPANSMTISVENKKDIHENRPTINIFFIVRASAKPRKAPAFPTRLHVMRR